MNRRALLAAAASAAAAASLPTPISATEAKDVMSATALYLSSARAQLDALRRGEISARSLLDQLLEHHAKANPGINAVVTLDIEGARAAADDADRHLTETGTTFGPLHGLPMTVKDALETQGMRTTCGSTDLTDHVPERDADAVALLRAAGAIIIGKTNVPTMCQDIQTSNPIFGKTKNPFDQTKTAGGSSGGPAAAVAAGLTSLEVGSDLAGSLRLPAAYCGVYALRTSRGASPIVPTRGHIPRPPGWLTSSDMLTLGPIARTAADLDVLLDVIAAPSPADGAAWKVHLPAPKLTSLSQYRIGIWADDTYCRVDSATRALLDYIVGLARSAGACIDDSCRPVDFTESDRLFQRLMYATASASATDTAFAADVEAAAAIPADDPSGFYLRSRTMRHRDWCRADEDRNKLRLKWADYFTRHDILITPATPTAAVDDQTTLPIPQRYIIVDGEKRSYFDQTSWLNLASPIGMPSITVPAGQTVDGLPLAIQIIGPYLADRTLVAAAKHLARLLPTPVAPKAL